VRAWLRLRIVLWFQSDSCAKTSGSSLQTVCRSSKDRELSYQTGFCQVGERCKVLRILAVGR
jgi:hypothetical protein